MAYLRNSTQGGFTIINNSIFHDKRLNLKDRGLLCTLISLPDNWEFSVNGLAASLEDGRDSIKASLNRLEEFGYLKRTEERIKGRFATYFELILEPKDEPEESEKLVSNSGSLNNEKNSDCGKSATHESKSVENTCFSESNVSKKSVTENPSRLIRHGKSVTENPTQYNKYNKINKYNKKINHINQSDKIDGDSLPGDNGSIDEIDVVTAMIKDNICYDLLIKHKPAYKNTVNEILDLMVDVCLSNSKTIRVGGEDKSADLVKSKFEKINYADIVYVLKCLSNTYREVKNVRNYLITTLYNAPMTCVSHHRMAGEYADYDELINGY